MLSSWALAEVKALRLAAMVTYPGLITPEVAAEYSGERMVNGKWTALL